MATRSRRRARTARREAIGRLVRGDVSADGYLALATAVVDLRLDLVQTSNLSSDHHDNYDIFNMFQISIFLETTKFPPDSSSSNAIVTYKIS